ncbi:hypothetical protein KC356_g3179 [Hortaea werneckii]|nr:hypothetical protein KC356_g3179 [Hortaea werneckii]
MRSIFAFLAALPAVLAAPLTARQDRPEEPIANSWIVKLRNDAILPDILTQVTSLVGVEPTHQYNFGEFKGFSIAGVSDLVGALSSLTAIESIEPDQIVRANAITRQVNPPSYGLVRISHRKNGASDYVYDDSAGAGTYAYIIDTGIYTQHNDFNGRATFGANFSPEENDNNDNNGHGTHVAGTTGSTTYGVAKKTNLIAVKVLGGDGSGALSGVIAGIDYAANDAVSKGRAGKSVGNLSLGGVLSPMTNQAVTAAVRQGLFLAVAAGNSGLPTITASPASAPDVCTVGAIDSNDARASFSNFGLLVDVFAPGVDIISTWIDGPDDTNTISGTSMASPHVAGLGAYLLGLPGKNYQGGKALCGTIKDLSTKNAIPLPLSPNRLAYNGNGAQ